MTTENDPRLLSLSMLLQLEHEARHAETQKELAFLFVNDTRQLLAYRQAFFWRWDDFGRKQIELASNVSEVDPHAQFTRWMLDVIEWQYEKNGGAMAVFTNMDLPQELREHWEESLAPYVLSVPLKGPEGADIGGLVLAAEIPWNQAHMTLAERMADAYAHAWAALDDSRRRKQVISHFRKYWRRYASVLAVLLLLPVRQYVLVPAEVVARDPYVVAAPIAGVVKEVNVRPNLPVRKNDVLFVLDDTELANRVIVAQKAFEVAQAEYLRNSQQAFNCDSCRAKLPELAAAVEKQRAEVDWVSAQLARSRITAPVEGVTVFTDENDWRGRPVSVGERVMLIADPADTRLQVSMPVADAIAVDAGTPVVFYSNVSPLDSYDAHIVTASYEASPTPDQILAYRIMATFDADQKPRLGMRGTAKVYGSRAPVAYYLLRRPAAWLRRTLGL